MFVTEKLGYFLFVFQNFVQSKFNFGYSFYILIAAIAPFIVGIIVVIFGAKNLSKKIKSKLCPSSLEEPEIQEGKDNNIMMF